MGRPRKDKTESEVESSCPDDHDEHVSRLESRVAELEAQVEALASAPKEETKVSISHEQREAVKFTLTWLSHLRSNSRSVDFRREAQRALAVLSGLL